MEKTYIATQKYLIMSPRKLRLVVALIKKMKPVDVIERMPFVEKRAGEPLAKVIKSAMANARQQGANDTELIFKEIQIGEGPRLKRGRPASRGRWHPFKKRMSHIRVILTTVAKKEEKITKVENKTAHKEKVDTKEVPQKGSKDRKETAGVLSEK